MARRGRSMIDWNGYRNEKPQIATWAEAINARQRRVAVRWPNIDETVVRGPRATNSASGAGRAEVKGGIG